jgi:hypothetical protein
MTCLTRTESQAYNTTRAKNYIRAVHYHAAFYDAPSQYIGADGISQDSANILLRHGDAILHITADGRAYLSATKTGSRNYGANSCLRDGDDTTYPKAIISKVPRYDRTAGPVDTHAALLATINAMVKKGHRFSIGKMF